VVGHHAGECFFVVGWLLDADRKGLELPPGRYGERGGRDRARIDAPAEEDSHGDVADEAMAYRGTQSFPESLGRRVHPRPRGLERHVPVAVDGNLAGAHGDGVARRELQDALENRVGIRDIPAREIAGEPAEVEVAADLGVGKERPHLGAEHKPPVALGEIEGLLPHPVSGGKEGLPFGVPEHKGEHPVEMGQAVFAVLLVGVNDHLGIGTAREPMTPSLEDLGQLAEVVDFAIEDDAERAALVGDRLLAGGEIDDLQPAVAESNGSVDEVAFLVGPAVAQSGRHAVNEIWIGAPLIQREEAAKAAHARPGCRSGDVWRSGGAACGYDRTIPRRWIANCTDGAGGFG